MNINETLNSKTTLEYLVMVNEKSYSHIGRELNITPQQFSDWIKKRRPIPEERLMALTDYFGIDASLIVDERNFARELHAVNKIEIKILLLKKMIEQGEDAKLHTEEIEKLKKEKDNQIRIGRLASILRREDESINKVIDEMLDKIEFDGGIN